jgi:hypothetical protein
VDEFFDERFDSALTEAMIRGRLAVEDYVAHMARALGEFVWSEIEATSRLLLAAVPQVRFIPFNPNQEGGSGNRTGTGADWLWWWIAPTGVCFGVLIQAKTLKRDAAGWSLDLAYRRRRQISDLLDASNILGVPAAYTLYCGPPEYRPDLSCGPDHSDAPDDRCWRSGVCVLPALAANDLIRWPDFNNTGRAARDAYEYAVPLEDLVNPATGPHFVYDLHLTIASAEVRAFLAQPQTPPLAIAKKIFHLVSRLRNIRASTTAPALHPAAADFPLYGDVPADTGQFSVPYFAHVLRGLRRQPPSYLADLAAGGAPPVWLSDHCAGLVLVDVV